MSLQVPGSAIVGDTLVIFKSSGFAERGFCGRCGSHIFHRLQDGPELAVSAGLFDQRGFRIAREIFHDRKPAFYRFDAESEKRTAAGMAREWLPRIAARWLKRGLRRERGP